jgi:hypothetical protein
MASNRKNARRANARRLARGEIHFSHDGVREGAVEPEAEGFTGS